MSEQQNFGFGKFVPGFDFLQNLAKGSSQSQAALPSLSNWVAPTLNVEELDKRIGELRAVHFWLDQNSRALGATIQALELQKMTLATLKGMNFNMAEIASALKVKPEDGDTKPAASTGSVAAAATEAVATARAGKKNGQAAKPGSGVVDPLQWWGALTQQFQEIAADAMKDAGKNPTLEAARNMTSAATQSATKAAADTAGAAKGGAARKGATAAKKAPAGKAAASARKTPRKSSAQGR